MDGKALGGATTGYLLPRLAGVGLLGLRFAGVDLAGPGLFGERAAGLPAPGLEAVLFMVMPPQIRATRSTRPHSSEMTSSMLSWVDAGLQRGSVG